MHRGKVIILSSFLIATASCSPELVTLEVQYPLGASRSYESSVAITNDEETVRINFLQQSKVVFLDDVVYLKQSLKMHGGRISDKFSRRTMPAEHFSLFQNSFIPLNEYLIPLTGKNSAFAYPKAFPWGEPMGADSAFTFLGKKSLNIQMGKTKKIKSDMRNENSPGSSNTRITLVKANESWIELRIEIATGILESDSKFSKHITSARLILDREIYWPLFLESQTRLLSGEDELTLITYSLNSR